MLVAGGSDSEPLRGEQGGGLSSQQPHHVRGRGRGQDDQPQEKKMFFFKNINQNFKKSELPRHKTLII